MMLIHSVGAVTAVGLSAPQTCAAIRARVSGITASTPQAPPAPALPTACIPAHDRLRKSEEAWLSSMATRAINECLANFVEDTRGLALLIGVPEPFRDHPGIEDGSGRQLVTRIVRRLRRGFSAHSRILQSGHAFVAEALAVASSLLATDEVDGVLIGATDSMLPDADRLQAMGRYYAARNPFGLIPGEGAAFFLVSRNDRPLPFPSIASIVGFGRAIESSHVLSERYSVGDGLRKAMIDALHDAGLEEARIGWRITDVNGERHRIWESSVLATRLYRSARNGLPVLHLPAFCGDVGSASGALAIVVAAIARARGYAPSGLAACELASEEGLRGACLVGPTGERSRRSTTVAFDGKAVIAAQLLHLPHDVAWLRRRRSALTRGRTLLEELAEHDERLEANMDLLRTFGQPGLNAVHAEMENGDIAQGFFLAVQYIHAGDRNALAQLSRTLFEAGAENILLSSFGWVSPALLKGLIRDLLVSSDPIDRCVGMAACELHGVSPGDAVLAAALAGDDMPLRQRALKAVGTLGLRNLVPLTESHCDSPDEKTAFLAARTAILLGDRGPALGSLRRICLSSSPLAPEALPLALHTLSMSEAHALLIQLAAEQKVRMLITGAGVAGDPSYVPWLIRQMTDDRLARLAGSALSLITGQNLVDAHQERRAPENFIAGPSDNPDDENVALDPDSELPWPDQEKIESWWQQNAMRFPAGIRHFMGAPVSQENCIRVLREGFQRQRALAAEYLCLLEPGTVLFNCAAPAGRQKRLLDKMG